EDNPSPISQNKTELDFREFIGMDYFMDEQHSYLGFKIKYFGFSPVRGRFENFNGTLFYNPEHIEATSVSVFVDVGSIDTGQDRRDEDLKREDTWFNATTFPIISFQSSEVILYEDANFDLIGDLRVKGITRTDTISFSAPTAISRDWAENEQVDFSGKFTIDRQEFEVFGGDFWSSIMENGLTQLSDEVEIELDIHCRRADYTARFNSEDSTSALVHVLRDVKEANRLLLEDPSSDEKLNSWTMTAIGRTLNEWGEHEKALISFGKKLEAYPEKHSTYNDIGVTYLHLGDNLAAKMQFEKSLQSDSTDSRAHEYLRLIRRMVND
ncbi:MAG: hypothetical protein HKO93_00110, partial [Flavobacteriales bacterium]|nr:hypothetical protein [Flavobacteriales bacterium]